VGGTVVSLPERQRKIYSWLFDETARRGFQPSGREASAHFGWRSPHAIVCHLNILRRHGYVEGPFNAARAIRFVLRPDGRPFLGFMPKDRAD
jgi:SOS-response transcriptional repressor LexA